MLFGLRLSGATIPVCFALASLLTWALNWLALVPCRRAADEHWTERARQLYPVRTGAALNRWLIPANCVLVLRNLMPDIQVPYVLVALSAWLGTMLGSFPFDRTIFPHLRFREWLRYISAVWLLRFSTWFGLIFAATVMPDSFGWQAALLGIAVLIFHLWINWGLWLWLARRFRLVGHAPERLKHIVSQAAQTMGVSVRNIWLLSGPYSYAAALPTTRELIFSARLLELHPDDEITAICSHELGHLTESRLTMICRLVASLTLFPWIFWRPALHTFEFPGIVMLGVVSSLVMVFARRLGRKMEVRSDRIAGEHEVVLGTYARALERLYRTNQVPAVMPGNQKVHPHLYDRLLAAGLTPEYPRPRAPHKLGWQAMVMYALLIILLATTIARQ